MFAVRAVQGCVPQSLGPDGARAGRPHAQHLRAGCAEQKGVLHLAATSPGHAATTGGRRLPSRELNQ